MAPLLNGAMFMRCFGFVVTCTANSNTFARQRNPYISGNAVYKCNTPGQVSSGVPTNSATFFGDLLPA